MCMPTDATGSKQQQLLFDDNGGPIIPPPPSSYIKNLLVLILMVLIGPIFAIPLILIKRKITMVEMFHLIKRVSYVTLYESIKTLPEYQNSNILQQVYREESAKHYVKKDTNHNALEWQPREGYCGKTTLRCALASYETFPKQYLPKATHEAVEPDKFCLILEEAIKQQQQQQNAEGDEGGEGGRCKNKDDSTTVVTIPKIHGKVISGSESYETFLQNIRRIQNNQNERIVVNFHRGVLFGYNMKQFWFSLMHYIISSFFGHFSPIIAVLERDDGSKEEYADNPLVAIFDVNHKYGGTYLVPAKRLYEAIHVPDVMTGECRAMVLLTNKSD